MNNEELALWTAEIEQRQDDMAQALNMATSRHLAHQAALGAIARAMPATLRRQVREDFCSTLAALQSGAALGPHDAAALAQQREVFQQAIQQLFPDAEEADT